jgi:hypothetical protein
MVGGSLVAVTPGGGDRARLSDWRRLAWLVDRLDAAGRHLMWRLLRAWAGLPRGVRTTIVDIAEDAERRERRPPTT